MIAGRQIPIIEGNERTIPKLEGCWGIYDRARMLIAIDETSPAHMRDFWLTHEVLHAVNDLSGMAYLSAAALGIRSDDPRLSEWEEALVRELTPHVLGAFGAPKVKK